MGSGGGPTGHPAGIKLDLELNYKNFTVGVIGDLLQIAIGTESGAVRYGFSLVDGSNLAKPTEPPES